MPKLESWSAPDKPLRGNMQRAKVSLDHRDGLAHLDLRASQRYQSAWVLRARTTLGHPLKAAWERLEREFSLAALSSYETLVDRLAPPIDLREYAPDTTRGIRRDVRDAVTMSRRNSGATDRLPPTVNVETTKQVFWLGAHTVIADTLSQSSVEAMHGVPEHKVSRNDAYAIVAHCVDLAKTGDVKSLTNVLLSSREILRDYGYLGNLDVRTQRYDGLLGTVYGTLGHVQRRELAKALR